MRETTFRGAWTRGVVAVGAWAIFTGSAAAQAVVDRGYSIPVIDLAGQAERQVVVDKEAGQYLGHPTTVLMGDGRTVWCVYPKGHGRGPILLKKSEDGGLTWSDRLETPASWVTSQETPTMYRVADGGGDRLIMFSGLYPIRIAASEDLGETWGELEPVGEYGGIVANADLAQREDGTLVSWFHDDGRFIEAYGREHAKQEGWPSGFAVYQITSGDAGRTWSEPAVVAHNSAVHLCEPGLVKSPDGETWALLLRENSRTRNSFVIFSEDEGETWSEPRELPGALTGDRHQAVYAPDGRLFISFRDTTRESETQGDWVAWVGTWEDIVEGAEGQYRVRLENNKHRWDCAYPGVLCLEDGTIVATTYGHWGEGEEPWILSVRVRLEELDAMAGG